MQDYREKVVLYVMGCFADMGATKEQLAVEAVLLRSDDRYLDQWAKVTGFCDRKMKKTKKGKGQVLWFNLSVKIFLKKIWSLAKTL